MITTSQVEQASGRIFHLMRNGPEQRDVEDFKEELLNLTPSAQKLFDFAGAVASRGTMGSCRATLEVAVASGLVAGMTGVGGALNALEAAGFFKKTWDVSGPQKGELALIRTSLSPELGALLNKFAEEMFSVLSEDDRVKLFLGLLLCGLIAGRELAAKEVTKR